MTRELVGRNFKESDIREIVTLAATEGIEISTTDFVKKDENTLVATVEFYPAERFLMWLGFVRK